jgi:hypothetical protein
MHEFGNEPVLRGADEHDGLASVVDGHHVS